MFNVVNVSYPEDVRERRKLTSDNLTVLDSKACVRLVSNLKAEDIKKSYSNNNHVFIGDLLPSIVKRYRPYDFYAKMYCVAGRKTERVLVTDNVPDYPGYSLAVMYANEDKSKLQNDYDEELIIDEKHVTGGILCDDILQTFYEAKSKENMMLVAKVRKMFKLEPDAFVSFLAANSSSVHMATDEDINDIIDKVQKQEK